MKQYIETSRGEPAEGSSQQRIRIAVEAFMNNAGHGEILSVKQSEQEDAHALFVNQSQLIAELFDHEGIHTGHIAMVGHGAGRGAVSSAHLVNDGVRNKLGDSPVSSQRQVGYASFIVFSQILLREDELNKLPMRWWAIMIRGFLGILLGIAAFFMPVATLLAFLSVRGLCLL